MRRTLISIAAAAALVATPSAMATRSDNGGGGDQNAVQVAQAVQSSTTTCTTGDISAGATVTIDCTSENDVTIAQNICQIQGDGDCVVEYVQSPGATGAKGATGAQGPPGPMGPAPTVGVLDPTDTTSPCFPEGGVTVTGSNGTVYTCDGAPGPEPDMCLNWPRDGRHDNPLEIMATLAAAGRHEVVVYFPTGQGLACVSLAYARAHAPHPTVKVVMVAPPKPKLTPRQACARLGSGYVWYDGRCAVAGKG